MMLTPSSAISDFAASAALLESDWLSLAMIWTSEPAILLTASMTNLSASPKAASGPDCGVT